MIDFLIYINYIFYVNLNIKDPYSEATNPLKTSNIPMEDAEQQPEDVIKRIMDEVEIEKEHGDFEQQELERLEKRLAELKANNKATGDQSEPRTSSNTDELKPVSKEIDPADALMKKLLQEAEISQKQKAQEEEEEDTWCCLCNDDATLKCLDCEDDPFCTRCYKYGYF